MDQYVCDHCGNRVAAHAVEVPLQGRRRPVPRAKRGVAIQMVAPFCRHADGRPTYQMRRDPPGG